MAASRVTEALHFQKTDLVQTARKDVDDVTIVSSPLCQAVVEEAMDKANDAQWESTN